MCHAYFKIHAADEGGEEKMKKSIVDNKICIVFENIREARDVLSALMVLPFYFEHKGSIFEVKNIKGSAVTLILKADIKELTNENKGGKIKV